MTADQKSQIKTLLQNKIESKLKRYSRESVSMPFLVKLMQDSKQVASYSFIHSLATTLGMSIYEDVARIIASHDAQECFTKYDIGGVISKEQKSVIDNILRELRNGEKQTDIKREIGEVLKADSSNGKAQKEGRIADLYLLREEREHYFEIKTVKPNIDVFAKSKQKLLEWIARRRKVVSVFLVFPYNPYHPDPYKRFTLQGLLKHGNDLLVGDSFWDFLGGKGTFTELLNIFDNVGKEFREKISTKIKEVADTRMNI